MPKSQPLKPDLAGFIGAAGGTNSDAKEPTTETMGFQPRRPSQGVPIQMPKSQPLKQAFFEAKAMQESTNSDAKEPTTET